LKSYNEVLIKLRGVVIEDVKTYLKFDFLQMSGQELYSNRHDTFVDDKYKTKHVEKFAKKYLIWQATCSCGSTPRSTSFWEL
jgi:hypothetical protein